MATTGEGFVIPARVVVSVEGLSKVKEELQKFVTASQTTGALGQRPIDPLTGQQATAQRMREETGALLNQTRQASILTRERLKQKDISEEERAILRQHLADQKQLEKSILSSTAKGRTEGGKRGLPIYPEGQPQFPTIALQEAKGYSPEMLEAARRTQAPVVGPPVAGPALTQRRAQTEPASTETGKLADASSKRITQEELLAKAEKELAAVVNVETSTGREIIEVNQATVRARAKQQAAAAKAAASDTEALAARAEAAKLQKDAALRAGLIERGYNPQAAAALKGEELRARAANVKTASAQAERALAAQRIQDREITAAADLRIRDRQLALKIRQREAELVKERIKTNEIPSGSLFQRFQTMLQPASGKLPEENLKAMQFLGDKFERSVGYAASGALIAFGVTAIAELYRDATQLEVTFVRLRGQLEGIGQAQSFEGVREGIRAIAAETGQASNDVAQFFSRMLGVNQEPAKAMLDTAAAMKLVTVTGLEWNAMMSSMVPITKSFGVSAEEVGNIVVDMGEKFGIAESDFIQFLGKVAVGAKQAGLSLNEVAIIGANMANSLGKPIEASSEAFNKATVLLQANATKIFQILNQNPGTQAAIPKMIDEMSKGKPGQALIEMLKVVNQLSSGQRNAILTGVVSRRESEDFNALITNAENILQDLQDAQDGTSDSTGKLNRRFRDLKETVVVTFQSINAAFESLGEVLLRLGIGDTLRDIGNALSILVSTVGFLTGGFAALNEKMAIGGVNPSDIIRLVGLFALLGAAQSRFIDSRKEGTVVAVAESGAEGENTRQKQANAVATGEATAAQQGLNETRQIGAGVAAGELLWMHPASRTRGLPGVQTAAVSEMTAFETMATGAMGAGVYAGVQDRAAVAAASAQTQATMRAAEASLLATGFGGRIKRVMPAFGKAYETRLASMETAIAGASVPPKVGLLERAFAGGTVLKSPAADALAPEIAGANSAFAGLMASPLLTGAIALIAIGYIKSKYDDLKTEQQQNNQELAAKLRRATDSELAEAARISRELGDSVYDQFVAGITGTVTQGKLTEAEVEFQRTTPLREEFGAVVRPKIPEKTDTKKYIENTAADMNKRMSEAYSEETKRAIQQAALSTPIGLELGKQAGILETPPRVDRYQRDLPKGQPNIAATVEQFAAFRKAIEEYTGPDTSITQTLERVKAAEQKQGVSPKVSELRNALARARKADAYVELFGGDAAAATEALSEWGGLKTKSMNELNALFQSGQIGEAEYIQGMRSATDLAQQLAKGLQGPEAEANRVATAQAIKAQQDVQVAVAKSALDFAARLGAVTSLTPKQDIRAASQTAYAALPVQARLQALPEMLQQDIEAQVERWKNIPSTDERIKAMAKGVQLSQLTIQTVFEQQFRVHEDATVAVNALANAMGKTTPEGHQEVATDLAAQIAAKAQEWGVPYQEAARRYITELMAMKYALAQAMWGPNSPPAQIAEAIKLINQANALGGLLTALPNLDLPKVEPSAARQEFDALEEGRKADEADTAKALAAASGNTLGQAAVRAEAAGRELARVRRQRDLGEGGVDDNAVKKAEAAKTEADIAQADAYFNYQQLVRQRQVTLANRDPVLENAAKMAIAVAARDRARAMGRKDEQAQAELQILELQQQQADNYVDIARAAIELRSAIDAEDPWRAAWDALDKARLELANAHGKAERDRAEAQIVEANRQIANAFADGLAAQAETMIALANLNDDPVLAANLTLQEAKRKLDEAKAKNISDPSVLEPLSRQVAEATKAAFLAPINKQIEDLDFLYNMERISLTQYISGLEAQLSRLSVNSREYRDLAQKIHNLKKQSEQDLQFNLPTTLGLPTLYEARRVGQSAGLGIGYQDNRNIAMVVNVNGAQDPMTITNQIVSALSAASGVTKTPMVGVGF